MVRTSRMRRLLSLPAIGVLAVAVPALAQEAAPKADAAQSDALDEARAVRREANTAGVQSQERIDKLSDDTDSLFARYRTTLRENDALVVYNRQMQELIDSQEAEMSSLADQLDRVELVGRSVTPLMLRMIGALDAFVELDVPFLLEERTERIQQLRDLMSRADVSNAEKYRAIMEAYQVENEFGRTIEAYRSALQKDGKEMTVDFLRFGRIALVYQTLDGEESGVWDQKTRSWQELDGSYRTAIREGLRIARKQSAPDLIRLPVPAAQRVEEAG